MQINAPSVNMLIIFTFFIKHIIKTKKSGTIVVRFWKLPERTRIVLDRTANFKNVLKLSVLIHVERTRLVRSSTQKIVVGLWYDSSFFTFLILRLSTMVVRF